MPHIPGEGNGDTLQYSGLEDFVQRSLAGYSPWSLTELDVTEWLTHTHPLCVEFPWWLSSKGSTRHAGDAGDMIPGSRRSPRGGKATYSNILACKIPWTEELGGLQSIGLQSQHDWATEHSTCLIYTCDIPREKWATQSSDLELLFIYHL